MPTIGRFNSLGTGDVAPLARLALTLPPDALDPGDGLALMSSNALTIGRAALAVVDLDRLLAAATVVTALTFLARDGAAGALHALAAGPFPGPRRVARTLRRLGAGSRRPARLQDQYGLRAAPQTLGIAVDAAATLREVVTALAGAGLGESAGDRRSAGIRGASRRFPRGAPDGRAGRRGPRPGPGGCRFGESAGPADRAAANPLLPVPPTRGATPTPDEARRSWPVGRPPRPGSWCSSTRPRPRWAPSGPRQSRPRRRPPGCPAASSRTRPTRRWPPISWRTRSAAMRVLVAVELVAAVRALRLRGLPVPNPLAQVWRVCARLPAEMNDRDLTDDVRDRRGTAGRDSALRCGRRGTIQRTHLTTRTACCDRRFALPVAVLPGRTRPDRRTRRTAGHRAGVQAGVAVRHHRLAGDRVRRRQGGARRPDVVQQRVREPDHRRYRRRAGSRRPRHDRSAVPHPAAQDADPGIHHAPTGPAAAPDRGHRRRSAGRHRGGRTSPRIWWTCSPCRSRRW